MLTPKKVRSETFALGIVRSFLFLVILTAPVSVLLTQTTKSFNPTASGGPGFFASLAPPDVTSLSPASATAGGPGFTLTVNGSGFISGFVIRINSVDRTTAFASATQLTTGILASEIATAGTFTVTVFDPDPVNGGESLPLTFTINNPIPTLTTIVPNTKIAGDPDFTLTVNGTNFRSTSIVRLNGSDRTTGFVSTTQLTAQVTAADVALAGTLPVTVFNPAPGGGTSAAVNLNVNNPAPTLTLLSPNSVSAGGTDFTLTVTGTNFVHGSVVRFNGTARTTTFVSATQLTATILATDLLTAGNFPITVFNPAPGGGTSAAVNLSVNPLITSISPASVRAGSGGFSLTVNGSGFAVGTVVRINGFNRSTTFINSTKLTASINNSDVANVGTSSITVRSPAPANLISNAVELTAIPSLDNLMPMTAIVGDPGFTITVTGSGFANGAVVQWNGANRTTTFINSTKLTASITAADIAVLGAVPVTVLNPAPTNLTSNALTFNVTNAPPATECAADADVTLADPGLIYAGPSRSQLWRNGSTWWGAFSNNLDGIYFYKQTSPTSWAKGALIDTNIVAGVFVAGAPDCLWNGTNLFIFIQENHLLAKLYKYTYNSGSETYSLITGFPINLPLTGPGTSSTGKIIPNIAIDQDSTGRLWAAITGTGNGGDGNVRVIYSTSADHKTWDTTGVVIASGVSTVNKEGAAIVAFEGNRIGVAWSNQITFETAFRYHNDADPVTTWSPKEIIDSGLGPEGTGNVAGKQMSMKAHPDGRLFLVSDDNDGLLNHLHLYIRPVGGPWGSKTLVVNDFSQSPSKPVLLLDTENSEVHVVFKNGAVGSNGLTGQTFITQASMTNPAFNEPCLLVDTSDSTTATSNPTSTKQSLNATTDLVVAASTGRKGNRILVNLVDLTPNAVTIFNLSPKEVTAGESASPLTLTVNGKLFVKPTTTPPGSIVRLNGVNKTTTYVNTGKLTATISTAETATAGSYPVTVLNPDGAVSNVKNLVVTATNPVPVANVILPNRHPVGSPQFTLEVIGSGFRRTSVVRFNGSNRATQFISDTKLMATILGSDQLVPGPFPVTVFTPTPGGGTSAVTKLSTFYVEPSCSESNPQIFSGHTLFNTNKSQMWYHNVWWGAFSDNQTGVYFFKQVANSYTQGALIDSNFNGRPDVLWNGTNLFILVYEFNTQARLYKYSYNSVTGTYALLTGFPVILPLTGIGIGTSDAQTGSITLAQDSTGKLWATYPGTGPGGAGNVRVIWSTSADHLTWDTTGFLLATGAATDTQEVSNIVHFQGNKIGVAWSNQVVKELGFRYHIDGDPETTWSTKEVIDSGLGDQIGLGGVADNHASLKAAPDGRLFLAQKDSDGVGYIHLYIRTAAGVWSAPVLVDIDPHALATRPTMLLDLENSDVYVIYEDANQALMYLSRASMNTPVFGPSCPYVTQITIGDITSTKQNLRASMGLRAAGATGDGDIYVNPVTLVAGSGNVPVLSSVSPASAGMGSGPFTLTINGSNFASSAVVYFNGMDRATTFVSSTQLTAKILSTDIGTLGTYPITVMNPKGGTSAAVTLTVSPNITSFSPASVMVGSGAFTLTVNGAGFIAGASVNFNGLSRTTSFVSSTQLTAQILASDVAVVGSYPVTVVNPGGATSPPSSFPVNNPLPTLANVSPASVIVGSGAFTLTVNGTNFNVSSVVQWNGSNRTTTLVSATQLTAQILASDVSTAGSFPVTVANPAPGGGTSGAMAVGVNNPVPTLTTISPASRTAGAAAFTLTVNGTNFVSGSVVRLNGSNRTTTFVSSTQLTAQITAADQTVAAILLITVFNPTPGGGTSNAVDLTINNPVPTLTSISPTTRNAGAAAFTLTVTGTNFKNTSVVRISGANRTTTFVSATSLTAQITAADQAAGGLYPITVFTPAPGGGTSAAVNLTVNNPLPTLASINPTVKTAGDAAFVLTATGTNFNPSSIVRFNGTDRVTTFVSATQLTAQITAADVAAAGTPGLTVFNPAPSGGTSVVRTLTVNNPAPTLTSISPATKFANDAAFDLTVNGTNFNASSVVRINGNARVTTLVSATQLTAQITAADLATAGSYPITVLNPTPGGGTSAAVNLAVNNNVPTALSIAPATKTAGDAAFTLTVNGTDFVNTSVVRFNGTNRTTTFVNTTQLTAQITAADVVAAGIFQITVFSPTPGGGTSAAIDLTVNNPAPTATSINPTTKIAGDAAFTLTVNGTNFNASSIVRIGNNNRTTAFVNATQITAQITAADVAAAGVFPVTVFNPTPGGGTSSAVNLTVNNPAPTATTISPTTKIAGDAAFTLTVNGTNFNASSVVRLGGNDRTTTFVSATQLTAQITAADVQAAGVLNVTVFNPTPGGGTSAAVNLTVNNPAPTATTISPTTKTAGDAAFTLTVNGTNFNASSVVQFGGSDRVTTLVSGTQLTAQITAADVLAAGTFPITVFNPTPGGGTSSAVNLTVNNPAPTATSINPTTKIAGDAAFTLTANGTNFNASSIVRFAGSDRVTTLVNGTQLTAQLTAADVLAAGTFPITVFNPTPGGGTSSAVNLTVNNPAPTATTINPTTKIAGDATFTLTVNGTNFNASSIVRFAGSDRVTTLVNGTQLTAQITAADVVAAGTFPITVFNPTPGGGTSSAVNLTVNNPAPTATTINPTTKIAGDAAFTLTVNGTNFNASSVVRFAGSARVTTLVNGTQLTAQLTAADVLAAGTFPITVFNPTPGGGTSSAVNLTVNNPAPTATSINPTTKIAGDAAFTLTVNGTNFNASSIVRFAGSDRVTTLVNGTQLTAQLTAADVLAAGTFPITVFNPTPGGGTSSAVNLTVNNPAPTATSINPTTKIAGDAAFALTVNGTNFNDSSVVRFAGSDRVTTLVNATQLTAQITAADILAAGTFQITVFNPAPGGGTSTAVDLTVNNPAPTATSISPSSKTAGDAAFNLTVNGTNFNASSVVRFAGSNRVTTLVNGTQLTAQITAADILAAGTFSITVFNPAPGGGTSAAVDLTVNNPAPTATTISPTAKIAGDAAFTLTVNGTNFNASSIVRFAGSDRVTTLVNGTQLTAQITATDVLAAGTFPVTVFNPAPGGGTSTAIDLTVNNPAPTATTISPTAKIAGDAAFTLTVNGTNFNASSIVRFAGSDRVTTLVNGTQLTAQLTAPDVLAAGTFPITVFNPAPGGGTSTAVDLTVNNPAPTATTISPTAKIAGDAGFTLTVNGTNFNASSVVRFAGSDRITTLVNGTQLTAQITAADVLAAGTFPITVFNPAPGGGTSAAADLTVNNPAPTASSISPTAKIAGDAAFTLTVNGTNFNASSIVRFGGSDRVTTLVNGTQLTAQITATDILAAGTFPITVFNPAPGGGTSAAVDLTVNNPAPTASGISPTSKIAGDAAFNLTVNGTNFNASSIVRFAGSDRPTTLVNSTELTAQLTASDVLAAGTFPVTVFNPGPGGGTSGPVDFTVNNPVPTTTSIDPTTKQAGDAAFTLTVQGTNFNASSVVRFNGSDRVTAFVNATQLTAQLTAGDLETAGIYSITVFNPNPAGGTSAAVPLTVNNPPPAASSISPTSKMAGDPAFNLTVNGANFNASSVVRLNGIDCPTTFVDDTQLVAQIAAAEVVIAGIFPIAVFNPAPGGGTSTSFDLTVNNPVPTATTLVPGSILEGAAAFVLNVNGTNFVTSSKVRWNGQLRDTTFVGSTQLTAQITAADVAAEGTANLTVESPAPGGGVSNSVSFTIDSNARIISAANSSGATNSSVTVPITLASQGDESSVNFGLTFDPALLSNPQAVLGSDASAAGATLNTDSSQVAQGRFGITVQLPANQSFAVGARHIVSVTFATASVAVQTSTPVGFTDEPVAREVFSSAANSLPTIYSSGIVTITIGYEADVAPRPNGSNNGTVTISDWVQTGRFSSGLDFAAVGSEFQRADCAPRATFGNGSITVSDWVQAGRFASGLDPITAANGPTGAGSTPEKATVATAAFAKEASVVKSWVRLLHTTSAVEQQVSVEIETLGPENALGFSLSFDPKQLRMVSVVKSDEFSMAALNVNQLQATEGRIGLTLALPSGRSFGAGKHRLVTITFARETTSTDGALPVFGDKPVAREVVDVEANPMSNKFEDASESGSNPIDSPQFFVMQHYLDFLNRAAEIDGLAYWTDQLWQCGADWACINQRRIAVSAAFYMEQEFQETGYAVYRLYRAAYGRRPSYNEFGADRGLVAGGAQSGPSLGQFAGQFVARAEFQRVYPGDLSASEFVARLYDTAGVSSSSANRRRTVEALINRTKTREQVLLELIELPEFKEREYNAAFVLMQYFGYLRRDPEPEGFDYWLGVLNHQDPGNYPGMVCSFITSREYQQRFSTLVTRSNQDCGH